MASPKKKSKISPAHRKFLSALLVKARAAKARKARGGK